MCSQRATPVEDVRVHKKRGESGWRAGTEILPTAVAGFLCIWTLDIRDRHQGNMVLTETNQGQQFANVAITSPP